MGGCTTLAVYNLLCNSADAGNNTDDDYPVSAIMFGLIKGVIGFFENHCRVSVWCWNNAISTNADGVAYLFVTVFHHLGLSTGKNRLGKAGYMACGFIANQQTKFFTAYPGWQVAGASTDSLDQCRK